MVDRNLLREYQIPDEILDAEFRKAFDGDDIEISDDWGEIYSDAPLEFNAGSIVPGRVIRIEGDDVLVDVGYKSEGMVPLNEWDDQPAPPEPGDEIEVLMEEFEDEFGLLLLSKRKADRIREWEKIISENAEGDVVTGKVVRKIKGGLLVNIGVNVFLPASQVDIRRPPDIGAYIDQDIECVILKIDESRRNIVVSRRKLIEEKREKLKKELLAELVEGDTRKGVVKNIADFGAFVDLGGIDGLLHITDMSWGRISHPTDMVKIDDRIEVKVLNIDREREKIALGLKQLTASPWDGVEAKYPVGARFTGRVTNITDYGTFVELEPGIEGLVHVSEMSWTKKNVHPGKIVSTSQEVEVMVLDVDPNKRRISLGLKQTMANPWENFSEQFPVGTEVEGEVRNITEFGLFVGLPGDIDGMVHLSDLDWERSGEEAIGDFNKGDQVKVKILDVDVEKERISLGIKQLSSDPFESGAATARKGDVVTCTVSQVNDGGIEVTTSAGLVGFIRRSDLSRDRAEQRPDRFAVGDKVDAKVTQIDRGSRKISLSIKAKEIEEEKEAMAQYGSSDSGASLGDILGAAIREKAEQAGGNED